MVIPSINCPDFKTASLHIKKAEKFSDWIHIDVSDGKFTDTRSWGSPSEFKSLNTDLNFEVHLMVEDPENWIEEWLKAGAKRVIVHLQALKDPKFFIDICKQYGAKAMLSLDPSISVEETIPYLGSFSAFQVLAVFPGPSGQKFREDTVVKVEVLRGRQPTATIEVDGGINESTGGLVKDAGADILVAGNYIFGSPDPESSYDRLSSV